MTYYVTAWTPTGVITGTGFTPDGTIPKGAIVCTEEQAKNTSQYAVDTSTTPPTVVNAPSAVLLAQAQASQIALLQSAFEKAEQSPLTYTTAGGVTATFLMTPHQWTKFMGAYLKYVVKGDALPSGYAFFEQNGKSVAVTVADISGIFDAGMAQIEGAMSKLSSLVAQVEAATTVSDVQAVNW